MKKIIALLIVMLTVSCVNGKVEIPDQSEQDKTGIVNLIEYNF